MTIVHVFGAKKKGPRYNDIINQRAYLLSSATGGSDVSAVLLVGVNGKDDF